jgi:hypothetical protein
MGVFAPSPGKSDLMKKCGAHAPEWGQQSARNAWLTMVNAIGSRSFALGRAIGAACSVS